MKEATTILIHLVDEYRVSKNYCTHSSNVIIIIASTTSVEKSSWVDSWTMLTGIEPFGPPSSPTKASVFNQEWVAILKHILTFCGIVEKKSVVFHHQLSSVRSWDSRCWNHHITACFYQVEPVWNCFIIIKQLGIGLFGIADVVTTHTGLRQSHRNPSH